MTITIPPELEQRIRTSADAENLSVQDYVERLIREDETWTELSEAALTPSDPEFDEIRRAVQVGLDQAERGESRPAAEVFSELRAKYGISR
ncbi:MAG: hypothetical protein IT168_12320 [Bryobacterales bacterium]|nr:hypothetical protein [Bryobacterales bacterium]